MPESAATDGQMAVAIGSTGPQELHVVAVLACHNRRDTTVQCLVALQQAGSLAAERFPGLRLSAVVTDDGSTDGTAAAVKALLPEALIASGDGTLYWAGGMALAEATATREYPDLTHLLWLNDDTNLLPKSLTMLLSASERHPSAIITGAVADKDNGAVIYSGIRCNRWHPGRNVKVNPTGSEQVVDTMNGNIVLVPKEVVAALGGIDATLGHARADYDYGRRAVALGYEVRLLGEACGLGSPNVESKAESLAGRWRALVSIKGTPPRTNARYMRRHAGLLWPVLAISPYISFAAREASAAVHWLLLRPRRLLGRR